MMFGAVRTPPVPKEPVARLWPGANLLREHHGDGHNAALLTLGVAGAEAHVLHALSEGMPAERFGRVSHLPRDAGRGRRRDAHTRPHRRPRLAYRPPVGKPRSGSGRSPTNSPPAPCVRRRGTTRARSAGHLSARSVPWLIARRVEDRVGPESMARIAGSGARQTAASPRCASCPAARQVGSRRRGPASRRRGPGVRSPGRR
jgi:hypothetical protein